MNETPKKYYHVTYEGRVEADTNALVQQKHMDASEPKEGSMNRPELLSMVQEQQRRVENWELWAQRHGFRFAGYTGDWYPIVEPFPLCRPKMRYFPQRSELAEIEALLSLVDPKTPESVTGPYSITWYEYQLKNGVPLSGEGYHNGLGKCVEWIRTLSVLIPKFLSTIRTLQGQAEADARNPARVFRAQAELDKEHTEAVDACARLRGVCAEAYQFAGQMGAAERILDNLGDAAHGAPLRHETFLPVTEADSSELSRLRAENDGLTKAIEAMRVRFCKCYYSQQNRCTACTLAALAGEHEL